MKECRDCKEVQSLESFVKNKLSKDGIDTLCKTCNRKRVKQWRKDNPDLRRIQQGRETGKDYDLNKQYRYNFGITIHDYNDMFLNQNGCCAICHKHQAEFTKRLAVDHCHETNKIRGLLCMNCNLMLGLIKENKETLKQAILYLDTTGY